MRTLAEIETKKQEMERKERRSRDARNRDDVLYYSGAIHALNWVLTSHEQGMMQ